MLNTRTIRKSCAATLSWLAMIAICLNPLSAALGQCGCADASSACSESATDNLTTGTCCDQKSPSEGDSCCSTKKRLPPQHQSTCLCNLNQERCSCAACKCSSDEQDSNLPPVAPPVNEYNQSPTLTWISLSGQTPHINRQNLELLRTSVSSSPVSQTAQQKCALLSRFTC